MQIDCAIWDVRAHLDGSHGNRIGVLKMLCVFYTERFPFYYMSWPYAIIHHIGITNPRLIAQFFLSIVRILQFF